MTTGKKIQLPEGLIRLKALLLADRRKLIVVCVLLAVALALAIRLLLGRNMPRRALARPARSAAVVSKRAAKSTQDVSALTLPEGLAGVDTRITRDLFGAYLESYPLVARQQAAAPGGMAHLQLQSIMPGPQPTAIINGLVVGVGDPVLERTGERLVDTGFVVASIQDKTCIVTQQCVAVKLEMKER